MKNLFMCAFIIIFSLILSTSCASNLTVPQTAAPSEVSKSNIEKDYILREASEENRPVWIYETEEWTKTQKDREDYLFFSFETAIKNDREVACDLAKASARAEIASEIVSYIEKTLGDSKEGSAAIDSNSPENKSINNYIESTIAEKSKAMVNGAQLVKTYWEKRNYLERKGAKKDYFAFTCAALIKIEKERVKRAIDETTQKIIQKIVDPGVKENVKKALKDVSENFDKKMSENKSPDKGV